MAKCRQCGIELERCPENVDTTSSFVDVFVRFRPHRGPMHAHVFDKNGVELKGEVLSDSRGDFHRIKLG